MMLREYNGNTNMKSIESRFFLSLLCVTYLVFNFPHCAQANELVGYTMIDEKTVDGEFEGCDFGKIIRFIDGTAFECSTFSYTFSFMPTAQIYARELKYQGNSFVDIKMVIDDDVYDMMPVLLD